MTPEGWVAKFCDDHGLEWDKLDVADRRAVLRAIPCNVRCWRVGVAVETKPGEPCSECGHPVPLPTAWDRVQGEDPV